MSKQLNTKTELRRTLRQQRQLLSPVIQAKASQDIVQHILNLPIFQQSAQIALYFPFDNEVDITALLSVPEKQFYLPVITDSLQLLFAHYLPGEPLTPNRFGINEPVSQHYCPATALDLVCMPLVGFDVQGDRLGTGAGYYDRTFAFKQNLPLKPYLLGIAYECQKATDLPRDEWDVKVWGVQTEVKLYQSI
jgi:5-formyltetrahydrofolate cyclo-ligase